MHARAEFHQRALSPDRGSTVAFKRGSRDTASQPLTPIYGTVYRYDKVVQVDESARTVRVQAGARVSQVVDALRPYNLTLENYASIREQQIGGFVQVGAHGTGAAIPPVDEQVIALQLVSPSLGTFELSAATGGDMFRMARLGLGALGVVTEVTLQCVPRHQLVETTSVISRAEARSGHAERLRRNKHVRYIWARVCCMMC